MTDTKFEDRFVFATVRMNDENKHLLAYVDGVPVVDALMEGDFVTHVRLFETLYMAMYEPEWVENDGYIRKKWPQERWSSRKEKEDWFMFLGNSHHTFWELNQPLPLEDWLDGVVAQLEKAFESIDVKHLRETVLEKAFGEIESCAHHRAMGRFIHDLMRKVCRFEGRSPWILKIGKRQIRAEPIINHEGKTLFLFFTGRGNRAVPMGALWYDYEERCLTGDRQLSVFFNQNEDLSSLVWFSEEKFSPMFLVEVLKQFPEAFAFEKNEERRDAWPWFYWCGLQHLLPIHEVTRDLFFHFDWMGELPVEDEGQRFSLFRALFVYWQCQEYEKRQDAQSQSDDIQQLN